MLLSTREKCGILEVESRRLRHSQISWLLFLAALLTFPKKHPLFYYFIFECEGTVHD